MFRVVERPRSGWKPAATEEPDEEKPFLSDKPRSDPTLDLLSLRQFCRTDPSGEVSLRLCGNELSQPRRGIYGDIPVAELAQKLIARRDIIDIDLSYNRVGDSGALALAQSLRDGWRVRRLNLMNNELTERGAQHLSAVLAASKTWLTALRLNGNELGVEGGRHVAWLLGQPNCILQELDLAQTGQTVGSLTALLTSLRSNTSLRDLVLDRPLLADGCDEAAVQLGIALRVNTTLRRLSVRKFGLTDDQMRFLCDGLAGNACLTELDLSANHLHRDAVKHLVAALAENETIRVLRLCHNRIQTEGALWLAQGLTDHGARDEVHIRANDVKSEGLLALLNELKYDRLRRLHFWGNPWCARVSAEVDVMWKTGVVDPSRVDVRPYVVDYMPHLAELSQQDRQEYYNVTKYGDRSNDKVRIGLAV